MTPGQAPDVAAFPALMQEVDCDPEQLLGDKGYDSGAVRQEIADHGGEALIPTKQNRKIQQTVDKAICGVLNNSRRVATRSDKLIESFAAFVILATIRIWIRFARTTRMACGGIDHGYHFGLGFGDGGCAGRDKRCS
jgi:hypothetical protein